MTPDLSRLAVRPDQKVSSVLKEHPELVDVFVQQSEHFERLRNPLLRRTFARMVTVSQAARVGNVPLPRLLAALNRAVGVNVSEQELASLEGAEPAGSEDAVAGGAPLWLLTAPVAAELDVREMQRRGEDPFAVIMDSARHTGAGQILRLLNTFEPLPLYQVLGRKGFAHWAEELGPEEWSISFYRERVVEIEEDVAPPFKLPETPTAASPPRTGRPEGAATGPAKGDEARGSEIEALFASEIPPGEHLVASVVSIELEDLVPPLPLQKVLEGLAPLAPGELLLVHHRRTPAHLFSKLEEQGHRYRVWDMGPDRKDILIRKAA